VYCRFQPSKWFLANAVPILGCCWHFTGTPCLPSLATHPSFFNNIWTVSTHTKHTGITVTKMAPCFAFTSRCRWQEVFQVAFSDLILKIKDNLTSASIQGTDFSIKNVWWCSAVTSCYLPVWIWPLQQAKLWSTQCDPYGSILQLLLQFKPYLY
jgi:hypothetical protein